MPDDALRPSAQPARPDGAVDAVLVTGASGGIGRALALGLAASGFRVIAAMRDPAGRNADAAGEMTQVGATVVEIDVTDDEAVRAGIAHALEAAGAIDVLVNNAGVVMHGAMEATTVEDLRNLFETNVLGPHRMVRAVLPHMRARGRGLVLQISSGAGRIVLPGGGAYSASKWALEAMSEALKRELGEFGVDCCIVEPGPFATGALARSLREPSDLGVRQAYRALDEAKREDRVRDGSGRGPVAADPAGVVAPVAGLIRSPRGSRPTRLLIHPYAELLEPYNRQLADIEAAVLHDRFPDFTSNGF